MRLAVRAWLETSRERGFLGPGPVEDHVHHAQGFASVLGDAPRRLLDLGSGGGLPGLVLAEHWGETEFVLLDSNERRTAFLAEAITGLGWDDRVRVVRERAEVAGRDDGLRGRFDAVVSRSFGPPPVTAECAAPFLRVGGLCVVSEPPAAVETGRWNAEGLGVVGLEQGGQVQVPDGATYQVLRQVGECPLRYPRRPGIPAKRPLW